MVEDLTSDADLIKREIKKSGIQFTEHVVETKEDYVKAIQDFNPDIILSDYSLPNFNGMQALIIRQELSPSIPFILVTGSINEETAVEVMKFGADDYVIKEHISRIGPAIKTAIEKKEIIRLKNTAEEKLKILQRAVEQNPASIIITDIKGEIEYVNPKFTELTGYSQNEALGQNPRILKSGTTTSEEYKRLWDAITSGKEWYGEFQNRKKNGEIYFESASISPITDEKGNITHFLAVKEDITERKRAEEALLRSRKEFQNYFDSNSIGLSVTASDKTWIEVNQRLCKIFGYSKEELTGLTWVDLSHPDDLSANMALFQQAINGEIDNYELEKRFIKKDGSVIYVTLSVVCQRNDDGSIHHFLSSYIDISEQKNAETLIKTLSKAIEQSPTSVIITDAEGKIEFVNTKFTSLMQYPLNEIKNKNLRIFNPGHVPKEVFEIMWKTLRSGSIWQAESLNRKKDGSTFWENVIISPLLDDKGATSNYIIISEDITEKKKMLDNLISAKKKTEESDELKTAFLHNISHEIRTPMNAIVGFAEFLSEPDLTPEKRNHFIDIIIQSSNQLLSIITDIVSISTIEAGQEKIREKEVNINKICNLINEQFIAKAQSQNVDLLYKTTLADNEANITTDETKLIQILTNLVGNALKFTKQGYVDFGYEVKGAQLEFYVRDTGIGIPPEMHVEIFNRFRQVETTTARQFGGSGLGLSISKAYVELLGGRIWLTSEPNKGSAFYFTLPLKVSSSASLSSKQSDDEMKIELKKPKTILIAEDQDSNYQLLEELLSELNINIIRAFNGIEAVEICKNQLVDLILMDIKMPKMDGYKATKLIKEFLPKIPIIAQTAYAMNEEKEKALKAGCDSYLTKPFKKGDLIAVINKYIED